MKIILPKSLLTSLFEREEENPTLKKGGVGGFVGICSKRFFETMTTCEAFLMNSLVKAMLRDLHAANGAVICA